VKAEAYAHLHAFSAAFEQAWDATQKLQPHLELTRDQLRQIYVRLQQLRFETLAALTEESAGFERAAQSRIQKLKVRWDAQEAERIRKHDEAEQARWAWEKRQKKQKGRGS
jgi:hypothetical protein